MTEQLAREAFEKAMVARFVERSDMTEEDARPYAEQVLQAMLDDEEIEFGADDYGWSKDEADELADTDMSYWEG